MAVKVANIKVYSPLKLHHGLTGKCRTICHTHNNLPLVVIRTSPCNSSDISLVKYKLNTLKI